MYYYSGGSRSNNSSPIQATSDLSTSTGQTSLKTALSNNNAPAQSQRRNFFPVEEKDPLTFKRSANQILQGYLSDSSSGTISPKSAPLSKDPTSLFEENSQMKQPSNNNAENSDQSEESTNLSNIPFETYSDHESSFLSKRKLSHQYRQYCQGQPFSDIFDKVTQPWNYRQSHQKLIDYGESM